MNHFRSTETDCRSSGTFPPVHPIQGHPLLHEAAQIHADDMVENDFFTHQGSDGSSFSQRIQRVGYPGFPVGENIAAGGNDAAHIVQRWINSDGHCANIMNGSAGHFGLGFAEGGPWGSYWVLKLAN